MEAGPTPWLSVCLFLATSKKMGVVLMFTCLDLKLVVFLTAQVVLNGHCYGFLEGRGPVVLSSFKSANCLESPYLTLFISI